MADTPTAEVGGAAPLSDFVIFRIGGEDVKVPALNLFTLRAARPLLETLRGDMEWMEYAEKVIDVIIIAQGERAKFSADELRRRCSIPEGRALIGSINELYITSGLSGDDDAGEAEASPGTGTLMPSSQSSPPETSVAATGTGSADLIPFDDIKP